MRSHTLIRLVIAALALVALAGATGCAGGSGHGADGTTGDQGTAPAVADPYGTTPATTYGGETSSSESPYQQAYDQQTEMYDQMAEDRGNSISGDERLVSPSSGEETTQPSSDYVYDGPQGSGYYGPTSDGGTEVLEPAE
jgi:hypothetical protein